MNAPRLVRCRYLDRWADQCTAEAIDEHGEILLCTAHLARALEMLRRIDSQAPDRQHAR